MTRKFKVGFVSPNFQQGPKEFNAYYLPYSVGVLWGYAIQFPEIADNYELVDMIWRRDDIQEAVDRLKDCNIVGFSTYIWNKNYNNLLASELKKVNPDIITIFGGPEPPITDPDIFLKLPHIDICVKLEGEITFKNILIEFLKDKNFTNVEGILINENGKVIDTGDGKRIKELDTIPSPYLEGIFDKLMAQHPEITWNVTIESNRGCPYACTFCDWGSLTYNKIKHFNIERVFSELEWTGKNGCDFLSLTDANFGMFPRDSDIADKLIEVQKKYSYPKNYTVSWAKNQKKEIVNIVKKLINEGGSKLGLNLSVQTMNDDVLGIIKRKNLETHKIEDIFKLCEENNVPLHTEMILGLPGETVNSWKENFYKIYKAGNHTGIAIYQAQLLENAEMNLFQRKLYKLEGVLTNDYLVFSGSDDAIPERVEIVVSTRDLPRDKMLECQVFSWLMNTFHINGITNYISRFLYKHKNIEYSEFYQQLYDTITKDEWLSSEITRIKEHYTKWANEGSIGHTPIKGIQIHGWNLIHSTMINIHNEDKHSHIFNIVSAFIKRYDLPKQIEDDLINIQSNYFINYHRIKEYPMQIKCSNDIIGYIQSDRDLNNEITYTFDFPEDKNISLQRYCEQIFFARRRNFGKAWLI